MSEKISYSEYQELKQTDPQTAMRAMRQGRVRGAPPALVSAMRGVPGSQSPLDSFKGALRERYAPPVGSDDEQES